MNLSEVVASIETAKSLPVAAVLAAAGVETFGLSAKCPFHDDNNPSLSIWNTQNGQMWKCWTCGISGGVRDLVAKLWPDENPDTTLASLPPIAARPNTAPVFNASYWNGIIAQVIGTSVSRSFVRDFLKQRGLGRLSAEWLEGRWGVCAMRSVGLIIPYYNAEGNLVGVKTRSVFGSDKPKSVAGSRFSDVMYGSWHRLPPEQSVRIVEGETDAWTSDAIFGYALGLPTGAMSTPRPELVPKSHRPPILMFDGDDAGRMATKRWVDALDVCYTYEMPDGKDVSDLYREGKL